MNKMKSLVLGLMAVIGSTGIAFAEDPTAATIISSAFAWIPVGTLATSVMTLLGLAILVPLAFSGYKLVRRVVGKV